VRQILISAEKVEKRATRIKEVQFEGDEEADLVIPAAVPARLAASK
jgi:hypothetical protein